jgi:hypothetical protein
LPVIFKANLNVLKRYRRYKNKLQKCCITKLLHMLSDNALDALHVTFSRRKDKNLLEIM